MPDLIGAGVPAAEVPKKTKFTPVDAARVALAARPVTLTPSRLRVVLCAATLWCRDLQFPTARQLARALGRSSPSTAVTMFSGLVGVHATVIALEWRRLEQGWMSTVAGDPIGWLVDHAHELAAIDPACLRLPALVSSAVASADRARAALRCDRLAPLHALAALADLSLSPPSRHRLRRVVVAGGSGWGDDLAVTA